MSSNGPTLGSEYDYIRMTLCDIHGIARGRTINAQRLKYMLENGFNMYAGIICMGARSEIIGHPEVAEINHGNNMCLPIPETLHPLPWASRVTGKRVGEMFCNVHWLSEGNPINEALPRYQVEKQLKRLRALGLDLKSAFEYEFIIVDSKTKEPLFEGVDYATHTNLSRHEDMLYEIEGSLREAGVNIECINNEYSPGQFEVTFEPQIGMKMAENAFIFKQAVKEICLRRGFTVSMMAKPTKNVGCGFHFNHSIVDTKGNNVTGDETKPHKLSDFGRWWIGGLMKHGLGCTALYCPTVNCYRRLSTPWTPCNVSWGVDSRMVGVRVRNNVPKNVFFEQRAPSASANPYLVVAATLAAGIDGIVNKIEPYAEGDAKDFPYPGSLPEALEALKGDSYMIETFGERFVQWFCRTKEEAEINLLPLSENMKEWSDEAVAAERERYCDWF